MRVAPDRPDHSENVGIALSQNPVTSATAATVTLYSADGLIAVQVRESNFGRWKIHTSAAKWGKLRNGFELFISIRRFIVCEFSYVLLRYATALSITSLLYGCEKCSSLGDYGKTSVTSGRWGKFEFNYARSIFNSVGYTESIHVTVLVAANILRVVFFFQRVDD